MKKILLGIIPKGYDTKQVIERDVWVNGEKRGTVIDYDPESGNITVEADETLIIEASNEVISISSRGCFQTL